LKNDDEDALACKSIFIRRHAEDTFLIPVDSSCSTQCHVHIKRVVRSRIVPERSELCAEARHIRARRERLHVRSLLQHCALSKNDPSSTVCMTVCYRSLRALTPCACLIDNFDCQGLLQLLHSACMRLRPYKVFHMDCALSVSGQVCYSCPATHIENLQCIVNEIARKRIHYLLDLQDLARLVPREQIAR
jgi:hypothetical protein